MIIILSIIVVAIMLFFIYQQFFSTSGIKENINFLRTGNLVANNPGMKDGVWYLAYETPGNPANTVQLSFDSKSVCNNESNSCIDLITGERVSVKGIEQNGNVLVREIEFLDSGEVNNTGE